MKLRNLFKVFLLLLISTSFISCDNNTTETTSHLTSGTWYIALNPGVYQDTYEYFELNKENRYMSIEVEYEYKSNDPTKNYSYNSYYGYDFIDLYMGRIITTNYNNELIPSNYWIEQDNNVLYKRDGV